MVTWKYYFVHIKYTYSKVINTVMHAKWQFNKNKYMCSKKCCVHN